WRCSIASCDERSGRATLCRSSRSTSTISKPSTTSSDMFGATSCGTTWARCLRMLRNSDLRCRYGGDEFLVMLPDTPLIGAEQVAGCLRREIATLEVAAGGKRISVTASIGVAAAIPGEINVTNFVDRVDSALYEAKRLGRNRFCVAPARS